MVRWRATLDWLMDRKARQRPASAMLQIILQMGLYQIFWLDRIPHHAAVNETVALARRLGCAAQAGFVNALLRGYLRDEDRTRALLAEIKTSQPDLGWSHPAWLVDRWRSRWGAAPLTSLLEWNNRPPATYARLNRLTADPARVLEQWRAEGVEYVPFERDWVEPDLVYELKSHPPLAQLPSFQQGQFYLQDPSTLLAVRMLELRPGQSVLDFCAAPGGKLTYTAQLMENAGRLVAHDTSPERVKQISENCARLGVKIVELAAPGAFDAPAAGPDGGTPGFDRILVDAPCSNTGVMRRRVDLRWRLRPDEIVRLREGQAALLRQTAGLLGPGGRLVYSTCSLEPEENQELVRGFLLGQDRLQLLSERELTPFADGVDGAYVAVLGGRTA